jgi:hypothetical protein
MGSLISFCAYALLGIEFLVLRPLKNEYHVPWENWQSVDSPFDQQDMIAIYGLFFSLVLSLLLSTTFPHAPFYLCTFIFAYPYLALLRDKYIFVGERVKRIQENLPPLGVNTDRRSDE